MTAPTEASVIFSTEFLHPLPQKTSKDYYVVFADEGLRHTGNSHTGHLWERQDKSLNPPEPNTRLTALILLSVQLSRGIAQTHAVLTTALQLTTEQNKSCSNHICFPVSLLLCCKDLTEFKTFLWTSLV